MANKRNPSSNAVLQALLDAADSGYGTMTINQLIAKLSSDSKLRQDMQAKWDGHAYPDKSMVYAQLGIDQRLFTLSDAGYKLITLLGMYCHQSGRIQAKLDDICAAIKVGRTSAKHAITELRECGAITVDVPASRHAAPIYRVDPALVHKGVRKRSDVSDYVARLTIKPEQYILSRELDMVVQTDTVRSGATLYARMYLAPAKRPDDAGPKRRKSKQSPQDAQIPGQMTLSDYVEGTYG